MDKQKNLHRSRLEKGLSQIENMKQLNAFDVDFSNWRSRVKQSLSELFGKDHDYTSRFFRLRFWEARMTIGRKPTWSGEDRETFGKDIYRAKQILIDALEELEVTPININKEQTRPPRHTPQVVVNVKNILSQTTDIQIAQIISDLDRLNLSPEEKAKAKNYAEEFSKESNGKQRWPILAKSLGALKKMGGKVYEHVAVPLLLGMLKKQAGFD